MTTFEWLQTTLEKEYGLAPDRLHADAGLEELGIDSLGVMELFFTVEDAFKITVPQEQVELKNIGEVADYIDRLIASQHAQQSSETTA